MKSYERIKNFQKIKIFVMDGEGHTINDKAMMEIKNFIHENC